MIFSAPFVIGNVFQYMNLHMNKLFYCPFCFFSLSLLFWRTEGFNCKGKTFSGALAAAWGRRRMVTAGSCWSRNWVWKHVSTIRCACIQLKRTSQLVE
ncbi:hypothetical protein VNO77_44640 [Canavalia gladiata]|uniref:Uncharacterized protein n=1 Tax=Canavalia gladiata TaxID=3824 RepID=A0AAN9JX26_CANGL